MKRLLVIAAVLALAACDQRSAISEMAKCNRELGSADAHLATAQADVDKKRLAVAYVVAFFVMLAVVHWHPAPPLRGAAPPHARTGSLPPVSG